MPPNTKECAFQIGPRWCFCGWDSRNASRNRAGILGGRVGPLSKQGWDWRVYPPKSVFKTSKVVQPLELWPSHFVCVYFSLYHTFFFWRTVSDLGSRSFQKGDFPNYYSYIISSLTWAWANYGDQTAEVTPSKGIPSKLALIQIQIWNYVQIGPESCTLNMRDMIQLYDCFWSGCRKPPPGT